MHTTRSRPASSRHNPTAPEFVEPYFARREVCRKCDALVWVHYILDEYGNEAGWGASPIGRCGNPERCGDKVTGLNNDDLALIDYLLAGSA